MATLNITVDDAQVARVRAAYGSATNAELRAAIITDIKQKVVSYEVSQAQNMAQDAVTQAQANLQTASATAKTNAEAISVT